MQSFSYYCPTKVLFGKDSEQQVAQQVQEFGGSRVFVVYGGGSVVRSGLLGRVQSALDGANLPCRMLGGVQPNPRLGLARQGVQEALSFGADFILAVGGGSVIDSSKAIAYGLAEDAGAECARYDRLIESLGGADLQLLGIGRNGHIGFNEPGEAFVRGTNCVQLTQSTIDANKRFFAREEDVPRKAYTMGIGGIMMARRVVLVACGEDKAEAVAKTVSGPITPEVPASILQLHRDFVLIADEAALSQLEK